jgi:hypothetical protein
VAEDLPDETMNAGYVELPDLWAEDPAPPFGAVPRRPWRMDRLLRAKLDQTDLSRRWQDLGAELVVIGQLLNRPFDSLSAASGFRAGLRERAQCAEAELRELVAQLTEEGM